MDEKIVECSHCGFEQEVEETELDIYSCPECGFGFTPDDFKRFS